MFADSVQTWIHGRFIDPDHIELSSQAHGIARIDFDSDKSVSHHGIDFQRNKIIRSVSAWLIRCHAYWFHLVQWREESRTLCIDHRCAESGRDLPRSLVPFAKSWTAPRPACAPGN